MPDSKSKLQAPSRPSADHTVIIHSPQETFMQIQISGHQVDVTPALRSYVESKLDRISRRFDNLTSLAVVLSVEKLQHRAEGTLAAAGAVLHADATEADMYAAIDVMIDKLDSQVRKHKEKMTDHHQAAAREARYG